MSIGERLKAIRKDLGLSQEKFSGDLSIHLRSYVSYEQGYRSLPQNVILQLLQMGYNINWLLTGEEKMRSTGVTNDVSHPEYIANQQIPLIKNIVEAFKDNDLPLRSFSSEKINRPEGNKDPFAYALQIRSLNDDSMMPFFSPEEIIIVSPLETVLNNDKAIIKLKDDRVLFKVLKFKDNQIELISANPKIPPINIPANELIFAHKVIGSLKV
ncbi:MAG: helix-turn-helix domain-containing protein [Candidatus Marinimicrobia bacterium]|nr:helix-turn-helix domain-containing protein [Candidatus Neomarinimicrobiota bacterium]